MSVYADVSAWLFLSLYYNLKCIINVRVHGKGRLFNTETYYIVI